MTRERRVRLVGAACLAAAMLSGCQASASRATSPSVPPPPGGSAPASTGPGLTKVLVIMEENHSSDQVFPAGMPYLYSLAKQYGYATAWSAISNPSLPNYLAIFGGSDFNNPQDCLPGPSCSYKGPSVFGQALSAGKTAKTYQEDAGSNCETSNSGDYDVNHNPWVYFSDETASCQTYDVASGTTSSGALSADVHSGQLPNVGLLSPNLIHDGHNGSLAQADAWLRSWVPVIQSGPDWQAGRLAIVVTFDEGENSQVVPFVMIAPGLHGAVVGTALNHYALTRLLDEVAGVPPLQKAASAPDIAASFGITIGPSSTSQVGPPPSSSTAAPAAGAGALQARYMTNLADGAINARYGFNLADVGADRTTIDGLPAGVRALVWVGDYDKTACGWEISDAKLATLLRPLDGDPKVAGFYIADEADDAMPPFGKCPDTPGQVRSRSALVHSLVPAAFTYEVVTEPANFAALATATDMMGADPYPCLVDKPCDMTMVPRYVAALEAAKVPRYWGVLQGFSDPTRRLPTPAELQATIDQWRQSRWVGAQVFAWTYAGSKLADQGDLLAVFHHFNVTGT